MQRNAQCRILTKAQVVVRLCFLEFLSQQEIAEALAIPVGTVKLRRAYGLQQLRKSVVAVPTSGPSSVPGNAREVARQERK